MNIKINYILYRLGQKELSKTVFPLYEYEKSQVRQLAYDFDLPPKSSKESQDICFIQNLILQRNILQINLEKSPEILLNCLQEKN